MASAKMPLAQAVPALAEISFHVGVWHVDLASRSISNGTQVKRLSPRGARLLEILAAAAGEAVSRGTLMDAVWPDVTVGDDSLTQAITELRRAFEDRRNASRMIETIPKYGYRLNAPVALTGGCDVALLPEASDCFDLEAYGLCLESRSLMSRGGVDWLLEPERLTWEAVERAPNFALAHAEHAIASGYRWLYQRGDDDGLYRALEHAERAVKLRPDAGFSYAAMAFTQGALGRGDRLRAALAEGLACDPDDGDLHYLGARSLLVMQDYRCAAALAERAAALNPDDFRPLYLAARMALVFDPARSRRNANACLARVQARLALDPTEPRALNTLGPLYAILGEADRCRKAMEAGAGLRSSLQFYDVVALAQIGDLDAASEAFEQVVDLGWRHKEWLMAEPALVALNQNQRFRKVAHSIGVA